MKLRWEKQRDGTWFAYSGRLTIGMVVDRMDGTIGYTVTGIHVKWIAKGYGDVSSIASGKRAVDRAWRQWLEAAGFVPPKEQK
jgi:hypothetical protein